MSYDVSWCPHLHDTHFRPFCQMKKLIFLLILLILGGCTLYAEAQTSTIIKQHQGEFQVIIPEGVSMETITALRDLNKDILNTTEKAMETDKEILKTQEWLDTLYYWLLFMTPLVILAVVAYFRARQRADLMRAQLQAQIFFASQRSLPGGSVSLAARLGLPIEVEDDGYRITR